MRRPAWVLLLVPALLAGCLDVPLPPETVVTDAPAPARPHVVVGVVDDGINPYHAAFRDASDEAWAHPSTYLPGYPATAQALRLTLNATFADGFAADAATWEAVEPGVLYWIPGTRVVAYVRTTPFESLDAEGYGTAAAGRAAGDGTSLAPDAKLAVVAGADVAGVEFAAAQPWIDVLLVGWNAQRVGADASRPGETRSAFTSLLSTFAADRLVVVAAGNGATASGVGAVGGVGAPAFLDATAGAPGVVAVGGHDNGKVTPWTGTLPHVVADARNAPAPSPADGQALVAASGTTASAAWVAGAAARLLLEARLLLNDTGLGARDGALAAGAADAPRPAAGPLADGTLDAAELRALLLKTADATVAADADADGAEWTHADGPLPVRPTLPVAWSQLPPGAWRYALVGYGTVTPASAEAASGILRGEADLPARDEDAWAERDAEIRRALGG